MQTPSGIIYFEKQRYNLRWLWLIYLFLGLPLLFVVLYSSWSQLQERAVNPEWPASGRVLLLLNGLSLFILLTVPVLINSMVLRVWVLSEEIKIKYGPWYRQEIDLDQVRQLQRVTFDPMEIFGTHDGYRTTRAIKKLGVFSVRGREGVKLRLQNGMEVLIGSQKPDILLEVLNRQIDKNREGSFN
jgi:hypothetical protein